MFVGHIIHPKSGSSNILTNNLFERIITNLKLYLLGEPFFLGEGFFYY